MENRTNNTPDEPSAEEIKRAEALLVQLDKLTERYLKLKDNDETILPEEK